MSTPDQDEPTGGADVFPTEVLRPEGLLPEAGPAPAAGRKRWVVSDKVQYLVTSFVSQGLRILTTLFMARLLTREDYGFVALAMVYPAFLANFGDLGVGRSLVHFREESRGLVEDTGLVISALMGVVVLIVSAASGVMLAVQYGNWHLLAIGVLVGLAGLLKCFYEFQMACLNRDLKFRQEAWQNLIFSVTTVATGITLALLGGGVYALVLQPLAAQVMANIAIHRQHALRWPRMATWAMAKRMIGYGWWVTLAGYVSNLNQTIASSFVGWRLGPAALGLIGRATQIRDLAGQNIVTSFDRLLYPLLKSVEQDHKRVQSAFERGLAACLLICVFGWACMTALAPEMVFVALGRKWGEVPILLMVVAPWLLFTPFSLMAAVAANVLGRPKAWLACSTSYVVLLIPGLLIGQYWGLAGIGVAMMGSMSLVTIFFYGWAGRALRISEKRVLIRSAPIVLAGFAAAGAMWLVKTWLWSRMGWSTDRMFFRADEILLAEANQSVPDRGFVRTIHVALASGGVGVAGGVVYLLVNVGLGWSTFREILALIRFRRVEK